MKKTILSAIFIIIAIVAFAQNPLDALKSKVTGSSIGTVLSDLGNGIKPESFKPTFQPSAWADSAAATNATDVPTASNLLGQLGSGLKPASLTKGFNLKNWKSQLKSVTSLPQLATKAQSLVKNIKPSAFKDGFDINKISSSLSLLKGL